MTFVPSLIPQILSCLHLPKIPNSILLSSFFLLIEFLVNKNIPTSLSNSWEIFKRVHIFSLNWFGCILQYFLLIISFLPVTPAANTRICFHLHTICARYTVSTKLICADDNKWKNKESFNMGEETKHSSALITCFLQKKKEQWTLKPFTNGKQFPQ